MPHRAVGICYPHLLFLSPCVAHFIHSFVSLAKQFLGIFFCFYFSSELRGGGIYAGGVWKLLLCFSNSLALTGTPSYPRVRVSFFIPLPKTFVFLVPLAKRRYYIHIKRKKTDAKSFIPLNPVAEQIFTLYNTTDESRPIFPLPNRNMIWYCIHEIGIMTGVKENLSYHDSRHTFGTLMLSADIPIESISKMMGHTNIRTTQIFARVTDNKISEDMNRLMEKRKIQN